MSCVQTEFLWFFGLKFGINIARQRHSYGHGNNKQQTGKPDDSSCIGELILRLIGKEIE